METTLRTINTAKDSIWIDRNDFIRIKTNEGFEFDAKDLERQFDTYKNLGADRKQKKMLLIDASHDYVMSKDARELLVANLRDHFNATAIVSRSFTTRLLLNYLHSFYEFRIPLKVFETEKEATEWLKQYRFNS